MMNSKTLTSPVDALAKIKHALVTANTRVERQSRKIGYLEADIAALKAQLRAHHIIPEVRNG